MIQRQHIHLVVLHLPDTWSNSNLKMLVFEERGKLKDLEKNHSEQRREPTTNSAHTRPHWNLNWPGQIGGRQVLSPLRHPCSNFIMEQPFVVRKSPERTKPLCVQWADSTVRSGEITALLQLLLVRIHQGIYRFETFSRLKNKKKQEGHQIGDQIGHHQIGDQRR